MPGKYDKIKLPRSLDRRVKLTDKQRSEIKTSGISIHQLSKIYGVCRRTIQVIKFPERLEAMKEARKKAGGYKKYYDKDKHRESMKNTRIYKRNLYNKGMI